MKIKDLNTIIEETVYKEVKSIILNESEQYEVYHIMCDGEPIATFKSEKEAKEQLPHYKDYVPKGKKLIIEKGVYESYSDMIHSLDEMGENFKEDKVEEVQDKKDMKKLKNQNEKIESKLNEDISEESQCDECGDKALDELFGDEHEVDVEDWDEVDQEVLKLIGGRNDEKTLKGMKTSEPETPKFKEDDYPYETEDDGMEDEPELDDNSDMSDDSEAALAGLSSDDEEELNEGPKVCSECGGMLNEEGMCNECGTMKEGKGLCSECGSMLNEEGTCNECGMGLGMAESKKRTIRLTESKLVELISKMINEAMKGDPGAPGIPGLVYTKKAQKGSQGENDQYIKDTQTKMKDYLKFEGNDNPEFPNEINKGEKAAYRNSEEQEAEIAKNKAGLQNLDYDIEPSEKFKERMKMAIEGDSKMGNGPTTGENSIKPSNGEKALDAKEEIGNVINSKKAAKKLEKQIKDRQEDKEERVLYDKQAVPVSSVNESEQKKKVIKEDIQKMLRLSSYNKKTQ